MITVSTPVRISLIGGSSDLDSYIDTHGKGSVISFTPNLCTYVSAYKDTLGKNNLEKKYIVNYSKREEVSSIKDISNDLVRELFTNSFMAPCSIHMTSDIFSHGSGLAVSSSYACSLVYAINKLKGKEITNMECGLQAHSLEKSINPLLGLQDVFGCCIGGFKKIEFVKGKLPKYTFLPTKLFSFYDAYLYFTGYTRNSTEVLKGVKVPTIDSFNPLVEQAESAIISEDYKSFMDIIKYGWEEKKRTSTSVLENPELKALDNWLSTYDNCAAHKLCGAGNGGFFLSFFKKGTEVPKEFHKIELNTDGVKQLI